MPNSIYPIPFQDKLSIDNTRTVNQNIVSSPFGNIDFRAGNGVNNRFNTWSIRWVALNLSEKIQLEQFFEDHGQRKPFAFTDTNENSRTVLFNDKLTITNVAENYYVETTLIESFDHVGSIIFPTPTPSPTRTVTPSPTVSLTPSVTRTVTPTPTRTRTVTPTPSVTISPTATQTPTPTITITPSVTPSIGSSPTPTPIPPSQTASPTPTASVTPTQTATPSVTVTITPTITITPTMTATPSPTVSLTPSITPTRTVTPSITPSTSPVPHQAYIGGQALGMMRLNISNLTVANNDIGGWIDPGTTSNGQLHGVISQSIDVSEDVVHAYMVYNSGTDIGRVDVSTNIQTHNAKPVKTVSYVQHTPNGVYAISTDGRTVYKYNNNLVLQNTITIRAFDDTPVGIGYSKYNGYLYLMFGSTRTALDTTDDSFSHTGSGGGGRAFAMTDDGTIAVYARNNGTNNQIQIFGVQLDGALGAIRAKDLWSGYSGVLQLVAMNGFAYVTREGTARPEVIHFTDAGQDRTFGTAAAQNLIKIIGKSEFNNRLYFRHRDGATNQIPVWNCNNIPETQVGTIVLTSNNFYGVGWPFVFESFQAPIVAPSPTPATSSTPTPTLTPTVTLSPTKTMTPTPTQTRTMTVTPSVTVSPTMTATPSPTVSLTPSVTRTATPAPSATVTPTSSVTPSITRTITPTPSVSPAAPGLLTSCTYHAIDIGRDEPMISIGTNSFIGIGGQTTGGRGGGYYKSVSIDSGTTWNELLISPESSYNYQATGLSFNPNNGVICFMGKIGTAISIHTIYKLSSISEPSATKEYELNSFTTGQIISPPTYCNNKFYIIQRIGSGSAAPVELWESDATASNWAFSSTVPFPNQASPTIGRTSNMFVSNDGTKLMFLWDGNYATYIYDTVLGTWDIVYNNNYNILLYSSHPAYSPLLDTWVTSTYDGLVAVFSKNKSDWFLVNYGNTITNINWHDGLNVFVGTNGSGISVYSVDGISWQEDIFIPVTLKCYHPTAQVGMSLLPVGVGVGNKDNYSRCIRSGVPLPVITPTPTPTPTMTVTPTITLSPTMTQTPTATPTQTVSPTVTASSSPTPTPVPVSPTPTPVPPTPSVTPSPMPGDFTFKTYVSGGPVHIRMAEGSVIDWGDGSATETITNKDTVHTHNYDGEYIGTISIGGGDSHGDTGICRNIAEIISWGSVPLTNGFSFDVEGWNSAFLTKVPNTEPPGLTNYYRLFWFASSFDHDISGWNTAGVTNMSWMFRGASVFNQPIGNWDTSSVGDFGNMFSAWTIFNQPIGNWNVSNASDFQAMFENNTVFNQDISNWNTASATNMSWMLLNCTSFDQDLSNWCVPLIASAPSDFATSSGMSGGQMPVWGTCPPQPTPTPTPIPPSSTPTSTPIYPSPTPSPTGTPIPPTPSNTPGLLNITNDQDGWSSPQYITVPEDTAWTRTWTFDVVNFVPPVLWFEVNVHHQIFPTMLPPTTERHYPTPSRCVITMTIPAEATPGEYRFIIAATVNDNKPAVQTSNVSYIITKE